MINSDDVYFFIEFFCLYAECDKVQALPRGGEHVKIAKTTQQWFEWNVCYATCSLASISSCRSYLCFSATDGNIVTEVKEMK